MRIRPPIRYKIVLNATTLVMGGCIQACVSFVRASLELAKDVEWVYFLSARVHDELSKLGVTIDSEHLRVFDESPAQSRAARRKVTEEVTFVRPHAVFTFFGPAYVKFHVPHLLGVADGWVTHSTMLAYRSLDSGMEKVTMFLRCVYKGWWYRPADRWVVEAECARNGLRSRMRIDASKVDIVENTCARHYLEKASEKYQLEKVKKVNMLTLSAYYPHKNLKSIPYVARELKRMLGNDDFQFVLTIPKGLRPAKDIAATSEKLNVADNVTNIGPVSVKDGPSLYSAIDVVFIPTLLETFSAGYPEAMACRKPIVTSDLDFAHDICRNAALFFNPLEPVSAARSIAELVNNKALQESLVIEGEKVLGKLPTAEQKYYMYEAILMKMMDER